MWHGSLKVQFSYVTWLILRGGDSYMYDTTHTWRQSFTDDMSHAYVLWLVERDMTRWKWHDPYGTWLTYISHDSIICDVTHPQMTWLICMCHDSWNVPFLYVTWIIRGGLTHIWHDSMTRDVTLSHVTWLIHMGQPMTHWTCHSRTWRNSHTCDDTTHAHMTWKHILRV